MTEQVGTGKNLHDAQSDWPIGGGITGQLIRDLDWSRTPLGPVSDWPQNLRLAVNSLVNSPLPQLLVWGPDHVAIYNDSYIGIAGGKHPAAMGTNIARTWPEIWAWNSEVLRKGFQGEVQEYREKYLSLNRDGQSEELILDLYYSPVHSEDGQRVDGVLCTVHDITQAVRARISLAESRAEMHSLTDALPILVGYLDPDLIFRLANGRYLDVFGVAPDQVIGQHKRSVVGPAYFASREPSLRRALAGETVINDAPVILPDGSTHMFEVRYIPRRDADGAVLGLYVLMVDIEDRKRSENELRDSNQRFAAAVSAIHGILWTNAPDGRMTGEQRGWQDLTGQSQQQYQDHGWLDAVHPDDRQGSHDSWQAAVAAKSTYTWEHRVRHRNGEWRNFAIRAVPSLDEQGNIREWVGVHTDITEQRMAEAQLVERARDLERQVRHRKRAEDQLRQLNEGLEARVESEVAQRRSAENALQQSQKMEAIGQLTGGIAHDFNNLLQVISGNLQLLTRAVGHDRQAAQRVGNALMAVQRGAKLASQLLAFGRRQALEPRAVHAGRLVGGMADMLRRSLGETIRIELTQAPDLWNSFMDPGQFENMLLNLAINARDAMEHGGRLEIALENAVLDGSCAETNPEVAPGEYVLLTVRDNGMGMTPEILDKVFEPFFSTKPEGRGTGLGLSMVYGFVRQSGGHVAITSAPGQGTTVRIWLPRTTAEEDAEPGAAPSLVEGGSETILVVEDNEAVRETVVDLLSDLGYKVLTAADAQAGLDLITGGAKVDLLFTDVVMPGPLSSHEMARRAHEHLPDLAVLFTSGYPENAIVHDGRLDPGVELLSKPYSHETLALRLKQTMSHQHATAPVADPRAAVQDLSGNLRILLVEDNFLIRADTAMTLEELGHQVTQTGNAEQAMTRLASADFDILLTDLGLPGQSGADLAREALIRWPDLGVIFATGESRLPDNSPERAVLLSKPYGTTEIETAIRQAIGHRTGS